MSLQHALKDTLERTPGLDLVAFGDLSSGVILNTASWEACPREVLDLVAERAASGFGALGALTLPEGCAGEAFGTSVIHFTESRTEIFARQPQAPDDVICALAKPGTPVLPALRASIGLAYHLAETP